MASDIHIAASDQDLDRSTIRARWVQSGIELRSGGDDRNLAGEMNLQNLAKTAKKSVLIFLLLLAYLLTSYGGSVPPIRSLVGSFLIVMIGRALWQESWKDWLGLEFELRTLILAAILAVPLMTLFSMAIRPMASSQNILYQSPISRHGILNPVYLHTLGQTLNEEMILGALLLNSVRKAVSRIHSLLIAAVVAAWFSLLHYAFYGWIVPPQFSGRLTAGTLFALFAIGLLRNTLILRDGHIAYAWSLHLSINTAGLLGLYTDRNGNKLLEPEIFNLILGSPAVIILGGFILILCAFLLMYKSRNLVTS